MKKTILQIFLHYSWDSEDHKSWVLELANRLTADGVELCFDRYDLQVGSNINHFMEKIETCDKVIYVMSSGYKAKVDSRSGGVGYEYQIMTSEMASDLIATKKFIPMLRNGDKATSIPMLLRPYVYLDMRDNKLFEQKYLELLHLIFDEPLVKKPELGKKPSLGADIEKTKPINSSLQIKMLKDVHDKVANTVYRVMADIEGDGEVDRERILDKLESIYNKSRNISYDKSDFIEPDFHETIKSLLLSSSDAKTAISLDNNTKSVWQGIDKSTQYQIKTIMQEIMDNMKNHSGATHVSWQFERSKNGILIIYKDNGIGMKIDNGRIEKENFNRQNGLSIIRTLLNSMGGDIDFNNAMPNGLNINISFPIGILSKADSYENRSISRPVIVAYDFTPYDIEIIKLLSQGVSQKALSHILESKNIKPSSLSSIEKRLNIIKLAYNLSGNAELVAFCKDKHII